MKKLTAGIRMKMTEHGVVVVSGEAEIKGRAADGTITVACGEETYEASNLLLCTGSETVIPAWQKLSTGRAVKHCRQKSFPHPSLLSVAA